MTSNVQYESLFGEKVERVAQHSQSPIGQGTPAFSHVPYIDPRAGFCKAKDDTCGARRVADSLYCVGHKKACEKSGEPQ